MFGPKHYVPILKWKRAEQNALQALHEKDKKLMTPLIQFVMPKPKAKDIPEKQFEAVISAFREKLPQLPQHILKAWGTAPIFIDFSLLYTTALKVESMKAITASGHALGMRLIPVSIRLVFAFISNEWLVGMRYKLILAYRLRGDVVPNSVEFCLATY